MKTILLTAYAICPYRGSEDGTAWNWTLQIAKTNKVILITRENNQPDIDRFFAENDIPQKENIQFLYFDLPKWQRFWKKKSRGAMLYFYLWQWRIVSFIKKQKLTFDIAHNLNFHNDWTPSFLWKLDKPFVWGPIGHHPKVPKNYILPIHGWRAYLADRYRWTLKRMFWGFDFHLTKCKQKSDAILAINSSVVKALQLNGKTTICPAVGAKPVNPKRTKSKIFDVLCVGRFVPLKSFEITLHAFGKFFETLSSEEKKTARLTLVGKGPMEKQLVSLTKKYGLENAVQIIKWMPQSELAAVYEKTSLFFFPSHEGAGMVVPEALSYGIPVMCFDNYGPGEFIDRSCGIKIPYSTYEQSVSQFANYLDVLFRYPEKLDKLSKGALERFDQHFDWSVKSEIVNEVYERLSA